MTETNSKFGAPVLQRLIEYPGVEVVGVVVREPGVLCEYYLDDPAPVDIASLAVEAALPLLRPEHINDHEVIEQLQTFAPDFFLIANYRQILREPVLRIPAMGTVNLHPGPLPRYAGLTPFFWMAKNGEHEGGTSLVWTTPEIDGGPLVAQRRVVLNGTETADRIMDLHFQASWQLLDDVLPSLLDGSFQVKEQDGQARTYFGRPQAEDRTIDWTQPTESILRTIRACSPDGALAVTASGSEFWIQAAEPVLGHGDSPVGPGEQRLFDHSTLAVRTGDGWLAVGRLSLNEDPAGERTTVANVPALLEALDLSAPVQAQPIGR